jgi:ABC-type phosphate transport system substrate-binding protein
MALVTVESPPRLHENPLQGRFRLAGEHVFYRKTLIACLFLAASVSLAAARDLALVSNKANSISVITLPDLIKVCKGQSNRWPDGKSITFIMRNPSAPEMKFFVEKIYATPEAEVKEIIATANHGRIGHPAVMIVDSDEDLVNKVASIPGAIGVVDVYAINSSVAVVKLGGKLPLEPGYLLHGN